MAAAALKKETNIINSEETTRLKSTLNNTSRSPDSDDENDTDKLYYKEDLFNQLNALYYQNILKFEQQFNSGQVGLINCGQDNEMKEILSNVDTYLNLCFNSIKEHDSLFNVNIKSNSINILSNSGANKKVVNKKSEIQTNSPATTNNTPTVVLPKIKTSFNTINNDIINITSALPFDLIHYGLKSGPIQNKYSNPVQPQSNVKQVYLEPIKIRKGGTVTIDPYSLTENNSLINNNNSNNGSRLDSRKMPIKPQTEAKNIIVLKYLVGLELNKNYFSIMNSMSDSNLYNIKSIRKPPNWSFSDYDLLTVSVDSKHTHESHLKSSSWTSSYGKIDEKSTKKRYLNSKAILDRLYKHFQHVLSNWPSKQNQQQGEQGVKFSISNDPTTKFCQQEKNQIKVTMKWKGNKIKDIDIVLFINFAIKYSNPHIENNLNESLKTIIGNFLHTNGCWFLNTSNIAITDEIIDKLIKYSEKIYNLDLKTTFLSADSGIHCWSLNLLPTKLNLLKYLCCLSSLSTNNLSMNNLNLFLSLFNITLNDLNNNASNIVNNPISNNNNTANSSNNTTTAKVGTGIIITNNNSTLVLNNNSTLFLIIKVIQIIKHIGFSTTGLEEKFDNELHNEEDLIANLAFNEINKCLQEAWSSENVFDRLWGILIDLRNSVSSLQMNDQFHVLNNILPKSWVSYIGFYTLPLLNSKTTIYDLNNQSNNTRKEEILNAIEIGMKYLLTNVCINEKDFTMFNYNKEPNSKDIESMSMISSAESHFRINSNNSKILKRKHTDTETAIIRTTVKSSIFDSSSTIIKNKF